MKFAQLGKDIVVDKIESGDFGVCGSRCSDDAEHRTSRLSSAPNQYRGFTGLDSGNDASAGDAGHFHIVDLIDHFPREVLAAPIRHMRCNEKAMPAPRRKGDEAWSDFER